MAEDYQTRKDVDTLYDLIWDSDNNQLSLATKQELIDIASKLGFDKSNADKFNFAIINKVDETEECIEYWILSNAYYDYDAQRFVKIDTDYTSHGIQIQAKGSYPNESELGYIDNTSIGVWRNPKASDVYYDETNYDYTDYAMKNYIGAFDLNNQKWKEFAISSGWSNTFMLDAYGGMTIGGAGFEVDGNGIFPYTRLTSSAYIDENNHAYALLGLLDNAYHPTLNGWECDNNNTYSWFIGLKTPQESYLVKDNTDTTFVVMYNDTDPYDSSNPRSDDDSIHYLDIESWNTILEVSPSSIKAMVGGVLTTLGTGGGGGDSEDISSAISIHNANSSAHATEMAKKLDKAQTGHNGEYLKVSNNEIGFASISSDINSAIDIHDGDSSAHATEMAKKLDIAQSDNNNKFLKVKNGEIGFESVTIPTASNTAPPSDVTGGSAGSGSSYALSNHRHPLCDDYAKSSDLTTHDSSPTAHSDEMKKKLDRVQVGHNGEFLRVINGEIDFQAITIPTPATSTPSSDTDGGYLGSGTKYALSNHQHPLCDDYATSDHDHDNKYAPITGSTAYAPASGSPNYAPISGSTNYAPASGSPNYAPISGSTNYAPITGSTEYAPMVHYHDSDYAPISGSTNYATSNHDHGIIKNNGTINSSSNENIVTSSNGTITTEAKNNHAHGEMDKDGKITGSSTYEMVQGVPVFSRSSDDKIVKGEISNSWVVDPNAHTTLGTTQRATQSSINTAIDNKFSTGVAGKTLATDFISGAVSGNTIDNDHIPTVKAVSDYLGGSGSTKFRQYADGVTIEDIKYNSSHDPAYPNHSYSNLYQYFKIYGEPSQQDQQGHSSASVQWYVERIADKLYDHDTSISSKADASSVSPIGHKHDGWVRITHDTGEHQLSSSAKLYANEDLKMCMLYYTRTTNSAQANRWYTWEDATAIPLEYRPPYMVTNMHNYGNRMVVNTDGSVQVVFTNQINTSTTVNCSFMWVYDPPTSS